MPEILGPNFYLVLFRNSVLGNEFPIQTKFIAQLFGCIQLFGRYVVLVEALADCVAWPRCCCEVHSSIKRS